MAQISDQPQELDDLCLLDQFMRFSIYNAGGSRFVLVDNTQREFDEFADNYELLAEICQTNERIEGLMDISLGAKKDVELSEAANCEIGQDIIKATQGGLLSEENTVVSHSERNCDSNQESGNREDTDRELRNRNKSVSQNEVDFRMRYFNADGKEGSFCGNGSLAAVEFARKLGLFSGRLTHFAACDGIHSATVDLSDDTFARVSLKMNDVTGIVQYSSSDYFLNTGSPHFVRFISTNIDDYDALDQSAAIRFDQRFTAYGGTNVNVVETSVTDPYSLKIRTYQRGNEAELDSCGTGSVAAAILNYMRLNNHVTDVAEAYAQRSNGNADGNSVQKNNAGTDENKCSPRSTKRIKTNFTSICGSLCVEFAPPVLSDTMPLGELVFSDVVLSGLVKQVA